MVFVSFFRTVSEAEAWMIFSQKPFIRWGVKIPAGLVPKVGNWVISSSSVGMSNKSLIKACDQVKTEKMNCPFRDRDETH